MLNTIRSIIMKIEIWFLHVMLLIITRIYSLSFRSKVDRFNYLIYHATDKIHN